MTYSVAIIGGGLAGLALSIDLRMRGYQVVVIEKGNYPRQKVCGEYISMESHRYLYTICPSLSNVMFPFIDQFKLSSVNGKYFTTKLNPGGFGISRYLLEFTLYNHATDLGVDFILNSKAIGISHIINNNSYTVTTNSKDIETFLVCNSTGRKSNLSDKSEKSFFADNYVGVKYHIALERNVNTIEIHNFPGGYCGISNVEDNISCLCYIVNSKILKKSLNSIEQMESIYLSKNPNLNHIFKNAKFISNSPCTISGITFQSNQPVDDLSFYLGDSAGSISPVTGNGMSMGLRSASALAFLIDHYFNSSISKSLLVSKYWDFWNSEFESRIKFSRLLQKLSESTYMAGLAINVFNLFPRVAQKVIQRTYGDLFYYKKGELCSLH